MYEFPGAAPHSDTCSLCASLEQHADTPSTYTLFLKTRSCIVAGVGLEFMISLLWPHES